MWYKIKYNIKQFFSNIRNLIRWFPIMWKDRDWDDYYIWIILETKLKNQAEYIKKRGHHLDADRDAERMMTCVRLIQKVKDEFYQMEYSDYHKSEYHFDDIPDKPGYSQLRIEELSENFDDYFKKYPRIYKQVMAMKKTSFSRSEKSGIAMNMAWINHKRAKSLLFKLLNQHIETWWD